MSIYNEFTSNEELNTYGTKKLIKYSKMLKKEYSTLLSYTNTYYPYIIFSEKVNDYIAVEKNYSEPIDQEEALFKKYRDKLNEVFEMLESRDDYAEVLKYLEDRKQVKLEKRNTKGCHTKSRGKRREEKRKARYNK